MTVPKGEWICPVCRELKERKAWLKGSKQKAHSTSIVSAQQMGQELDEIQKKQLLIIKELEQTKLHTMESDLAALRENTTPAVNPVKKRNKSAAKAVEVSKSVMGAPAKTLADMSKSVLN